MFDLEFNLWELERSLSEDLHDRIGGMMESVRRVMTIARRTIAEVQDSPSTESELANRRRAVRCCCLIESLRLQHCLLKRYREMGTPQPEETDLRILLHQLRQLRTFFRWRQWLSRDRDYYSGVDRDLSEAESWWMTARSDRREVARTVDLTVAQVRDVDQNIKRLSRLLS